MAETPFLIYGNNLSTTANSTIYTSPSNKVVVIKSIIVCNLQNTPISLSMRIEGTPVVFQKQLKSYETLVIPVADLILRPSAALNAWVSSGTCAIRITGNEIDGTMSQNGLFYFGTSVGSSGNPKNIVIPSGNLSVIKSLVFCNASSLDVDLFMRIGYFAGNYELISNHKLAAYETIHIPFVDTVLLGTDTITAWVTQAIGSVYCHVVTKAVYS